MMPIISLVRIAHGSNLYGTCTPASDRDYKGVHLPSGEAILLQRAEDVVERGVVAKHGTKNTSDAVDEQSYSVQKFFGMLAKGDTVATEILFAPALEVDPRWSEIQRVGASLLNRQCKGFVGYCVRQAAKYGIKGSRMGAVKRVIDYLDTLPQDATTKLGEYETSLRNITDGMEHVSWANIPHPHGADCWHLDVCDRKMPMTVTVKEAWAVYGKVWENYGERARAAMTNEGIDWKAVSHAVRVARQAIELLQTGAITFPRPDAAELLEIKQGLRPYAEVSALLESLVAEVHVVSEASLLPSVSDTATADATVRRYYLTQIIDEPAQGTEARRAETGTGSVHDGPVA